MTCQFLPVPPLPDWLEEELPFNRRMFSDGEHAIHFIDEGDGPPVILQHGNPTWCYLWRKVIRILAQENVRIIAPDLVGLGLSSKPRDLKVHTLDFHADRISSLVRALDLHDITIAGQDWGGPIVAVMAARNRERIHGAVFGNTAIRVPSRKPRRTPFHRFSHMPLVSGLFFRVFNLPVLFLGVVQGDRSSIGPPSAAPIGGRCSDTRTVPHHWPWRGSSRRASIARSSRPCERGRTGRDPLPVRSASCGACATRS